MNLVRNFLVILICLAIHDFSIGCTIITSSSGNVVFAGNNEDMCTTNTEIHMIPFGENGYGRILWGFIGDENYQGGMNEHGLFFDGAGIPKVKMSPGILPEFKGRYIMETILEQCKTVDEAIILLKKYSHPSLQYGHNLIADETGDAAIIEWGNDRLNILRKEDKDYLIATNFNISESKDINSECQRYNIVEDILSIENPSLESFEKALSLTQQEGRFCTVYSNICDLRNKKVFLYNFHNFAISKELDLVEELKKGEKKYRIRDLFPPNYAEMVFRMRQDCIADFEGVPTRDVEFIIQSETRIPQCKISLRGSSEELGRWDQEGVPMEKESDYKYVKSISFKEGTLFDFELSVDNDQYNPVDNNSNRLKEIVLEVTSDTTLVINVSDWTPIPDTIRAKEISGMKFGMFICWSFSTFYGEEWTPTLDKDALYFKATGCDTDQWCRAAKDAGMKYILFLSKHHDGFCLWDTKTTHKKVTNSPIGIDVLAQLRKSCDKFGIKLAIYFSEGDWNWPGAVDGKGFSQGAGINPDMKKAQLEELCTQYGPIEFFWMDHAAGDGGLNHIETVDWVHQFQANCFVGFNHGQPAGRLSLREMGKPGPIGDAGTTKYNKDAEANYKGYLAAEFTYPILPPHEGGAMWFYSLPIHDTLCHPVEKLYQDYRGAVEHGNIFSINVGPDYKGRIRDIDVKTLRTVGELIQKNIPR